MAVGTKALLVFLYKRKRKINIYCDASMFNNIFLSFKKVSKISTRLEICTIYLHIVHITLLCTTEASFLLSINIFIFGKSFFHHNLF